MFWLDVFGRFRFSARLAFFTFVGIQLPGFWIFEGQMLTACIVNLALALGDLLALFEMKVQFCPIPSIRHLQSPIVGFMSERSLGG